MKIFFNELNLTSNFFKASVFYKHIAFYGCNERTFKELNQEDGGGVSATFVTTLLDKDNSGKGVLKLVSAEFKMPCDPRVMSLNSKGKDELDIVLDMLSKPYNETGDTIIAWAALDRYVLNLFSDLTDTMTSIFHLHKNNDRSQDEEMKALIMNFFEHKMRPLFSERSGLSEKWEPFINSFYTEVFDFPPHSTESLFESTLKIFKNDFLTPMYNLRLNFKNIFDKPLKTIAPKLIDKMKDKIKSDRYYALTAYTLTAGTNYSFRSVIFWTTCLILLGDHADTGAPVHLLQKLKEVTKALLTYDFSGELFKQHQKSWKEHRIVFLKHINTLNRYGNRQDFEIEKRAYIRAMDVLLRCDVGADGELSFGEPWTLSDVLSNLNSNNKKTMCKTESMENFDTHKFADGCVMAKQSDRLFSQDPLTYPFDGLDFSSVTSLKEACLILAHSSNFMREEIIELRSLGRGYLADLKDDVENKESVQEIQNYSEEELFFYIHRQQRATPKQKQTMAYNVDRYSTILDDINNLWCKNLSMMNSILVVSDINPSILPLVYMIWMQGDIDTQAFVSHDIPVPRGYIIKKDMDYFEANILKALEKSKGSIPNLNEHWKIRENSGLTPTIIARFLASAIIHHIFVDTARLKDVPTYFNEMKMIQENNDFTEYILRVVLLTCVDNDWFSGNNERKLGVHSLWTILEEKERKQQSKILRQVQTFLGDQYEKVAERLSKEVEQHVSDNVMKERNEIYKQFVHFRKKLDEQFLHSSKRRYYLWEEIKNRLNRLITNHVYHYSSKSSRYNHDLIEDPEKGWVQKKKSFDELAEILKTGMEHPQS